MHWGGPTGWVSPGGSMLLPSSAGIMGWGSPNQGPGPSRSRDSPSPVFALLKCHQDHAGLGSVSTISSNTSSSSSREGLELRTGAAVIDMGMRSCKAGFSTGEEAAPPPAQGQGSEAMLKSCPQLPGPQAPRVLCCLPTTLVAQGAHGHFPIPVPTTPPDQVESTDHSAPY